MACPKCGCKETYQYDGGGGFDGIDGWFENLERCAEAMQYQKLHASDTELQGVSGQ